MGTISVSLPSDGTTAYVADYNTPITTIVNVINGGLDNANIAANAGIAGSKLADGGVIPTKWSNPYSFSVYRNAAFNITSSFAKVQFDTESFDPNSNFDSATNFRYVAPVAGIYFFSWMVGVPITNTDAVAAIYKNGTIFAWGNETKDSGAGGTKLVQAAANDYFEIFVVGSGTLAAGVGSAPVKTYFDGFLVNQT